MSGPEELSSVVCCVCGERFGLDEATATVLVRSGASVYCPWGHDIVLAPFVKNHELILIDGGKK